MALHTELDVYKTGYDLFGKVTMIVANMERTFKRLIGETIDGFGRLPVTFMLLQPPSWMDDVWTDVARMRTLNMIQSQKGKEQHLCPMQFDIADRVIERFTNPGETVYDPFGGIMSVPYRALLKGRKAVACELSSRYFMDGVHYLQAAEREAAMPSLFDTFDLKEAA